MHLTTEIQSLAQTAAGAFVPWVFIQARNRYRYRKVTGRYLQIAGSDREERKFSILKLQVNLATGRLHLNGSNYATDTGRVIRRFQGEATTSLHDSRTLAYSYVSSCPGIHPFEGSGAIYLSDDTLEPLEGYFVSTADVSAVAVRYSRIPDNISDTVALAKAIAAEKPTLLNGQANVAIQTS